MNEPLLHFFICSNVRGVQDPLPSCGHNGAAELLEAFYGAIAKAGLSTTIKVTSTGCLTPCSNGPNVVVYPAATWYCKVQPSDVNEIIETHMRGSRVDRLLLPKSVRLL